MLLFYSRILAIGGRKEKVELAPPIVTDGGSFTKEFMPSRGVDEVLSMGEFLYKLGIVAYVNNPVL